MNIRFSLILGSALVAWSTQAWTWLTQPQVEDRSALIELVAQDIQANDELAYLPGWEQHWALQLGQRFPDHPQRLGSVDVVRPFQRLWVFESYDAPSISWLKSKDIEVLRTIDNQGLKAVSYTHLTLPTIYSV